MDFNDEILNVTLKFSNPGRGEMLDADKLAAKLSLSLDNVIRRAVAAGKPIGDITSGIAQLEPTLKSLEKRMGNLAAGANVLQLTQRALSRYTPARLEKMAEVAASRIAETSGSAALRRELLKLTSAVKEMSGKLPERATKNNPVGRGVYLDTETTGLNAAKHQIVELAATLFTFNKKTGEIINAAERTYHSFQDLETEFRKRRDRSAKELASAGPRVRDPLTGEYRRGPLPAQTTRAIEGQARWLLPSGVTREMLRGQQISPTALLALLKKADFVAAHNVNHDKAFVQKIIPQVGNMVWRDSMRDVPWRSLGFGGRDLQGLLRRHGIAPGQAHRATDDVTAAIKLLGARPPLGGPTNLSMMLGSRGSGLNEAQQLTAVYKEGAQLIKEGLEARLGSGKFSRVSVKYKQDSERVDPEYRRERLYIDSIEGQITARNRRPARSTDYGIKTGTGGKDESTPGQLGESAVHLDRLVGVVDEFVRNATIMSGPGSAVAFNSVVAQQAKYQEALQQSRGMGRQIKAEIRPGEGISLAAMAGVNTRLQNQRLIDSGEREPLPLYTFDQLMKRHTQNRNETVANMLTQPWAKPSKAFAESEIKDFISTNLRSPKIEHVPIAAQMLNQLVPRLTNSLPSMLPNLSDEELAKWHLPMSAKPERFRKASLPSPEKVSSFYATDASKHPQAMALSSILLSGQESGRKLLTARQEKEEQERTKKILDNAKPGKKPRNFAAGIDFNDPQAGGLRMGEILSALGGLFGRKKTAVGQQGLSYDERARNPLPDPTSLRGSIRRDALDQKLKKLEDAINDTAKVFEHYRDVIASSKVSDAVNKLSAKESDISRAQATAKLGFDSQLGSIEARRQRSRTRSSQSVQNLQASFEDKSAALVKEQLDAELQLEVAKARQKKAFRSEAKALDKSPGQLTQFERDEIQDRLRPITRPAEMRLIRAKYARESAELSGPDLEALRSQTATALTKARYGPNASPGDTQKYTEDAMASLGARTPGQRTQSGIAQVSQAQKQTEQELDALVGKTQKKRELSEEKFETQKRQAEQKTAQTVNKVQDEILHKEEAATKKKLTLADQLHKAKVSFLKKEDAAGASGGGGSKGGGGGSFLGGLFSGQPSRTGMGFGIGLPALIGFDTALKDVIKDSAIYAARTQTMAAATHNMASVAGLNRDEVDAQVESLKKLNITTQSAQGVVQRLMMTEIDLSKATGLVRVAQDLAAVSGADAMETTERLMSAIVTGYTRNLHMLGLQVTMTSTLNQLRNEKKSKGEKGEPTEVEKRQALVNKIMLEGAKISGNYERSLTTAGGQYAYLRKEIQETENALGTEFLPTFGRVVKMMTDGLHIVQAHSEGFATLAKILASVSAGFSVLGTASFASFLGLPMPPQLKIAVGVAAAAASIGTGIALGGSNSDANKKTAQESQDRIQKQVASLREARKYLFANQDTSDEWKNKLEMNTASLKAYGDTQVDINKDLTQKQAAEYNKQLADLDHFVKAKAGKLGLLSLLTADFTGFEGGLGEVAPHPTTMGVPYDQDPVVKAFVEKKKKDYARSLSTSTISPEDVVAEAARMRDTTQPTGPMANYADINAKALYSAFTGANTEVSKLAEKYRDFGPAQARSMKMGETQRGKILTDYQDEVEKANLPVYDKILDLQKKAKSGKDPEAKREYDYFLAQGGNPAKAEGALTEQLKEQAAVRDNMAKARDEALAGVSRHTQTEIAAIRLQTQIEQVNSNVVQGNYAAEYAAAEKVFELRKKNIAENSKRYGAAVYKDESDKQTVAAEEELKQRQDQIETAKRDANRSRLEYGTRQAAEVDAQRALENPNVGGEKAIKDSFDIRQKATEVIENTNDKLAEQQRLYFELDAALLQYSKDQKSLAVESQIAVFNDQQDLQSELDKLLSGRRGGRGGMQESLDEIERTKQRKIAEAQNAFDQRSKEDLNPSQRDDLAEQKTQAIRQAGNQALVESGKVFRQEVEAAGQRLVDAYQEQFQNVAKINELEAIGPAQEAEAAHNTYQLRLEYIQKEADARLKALVSEDEVERQMNKEKAQAEFDELQRLMQLQRAEVEKLRGVAGSVFDALTAHDGGLSMRKLMQDQLKGIGRTIFQNIAQETFKGAGAKLGSIIKGQETIDPVTGKRTLTKLGRVLSGTPFGVSHTDEIEQLKLSATKDNTAAEEELTKAVERLTDSIRKGSGGPTPGAPMPVPVNLRLPTPVTSSTTSGSIFSGYDPSSVFITHFAAMSTLGSTLGKKVDDNTKAENNNTGALNTNSQMLAMSAAAMVAALSSMGGGWGGGGGGTSSGFLGFAPSMGFSGGGSLGAPNLGPQVTSPGALSSLSGMLGMGGGGGGFSQSPIMYGMPGAGGSSMKGGTSLANIGMIAGGAYQAYTGFKTGGARNIASGIGGALMTAAGAAAMFGGPAGLVAAPFLLGAAAVADLVSAFLPDPKAQRQKQIDQYMLANKYLAPTQINREMSLTGNLLSYGTNGLPRDTGLGAFPIPLQPTARYPNFYGAGPVPGYIEIPGRVLPPGRASGGSVSSGQPYIVGENGPELFVPGSAGYISPNSMPKSNRQGSSVTYHISLPISAMDSKDVLARSGDIAAALRKELRLGSDLSISLQEAIFGAGA